LYDNQIPQVLHVGYAGDIVLVGGRLWRSTEVTLGAQVADRISVLPDMEGIVATFDCIRPEFLWGRVPEGTRLPIAVKVWTGEGNTSSGGDVTLEVTNDKTRIPVGAKPCRPDKVEQGSKELAQPVARTNPPGEGATPPASR